MSSKATLARLKKLEQAVPAAPLPECGAHARLCPTSSGSWPGGADVANAYQNRHGVDFQALPCEPGDGTDAARRLAQAGVLHTQGANGTVVYIIASADLETMS